MNLPPSFTLIREKYYAIVLKVVAFRDG